MTDRLAGDVEHIAPDLASVRAARDRALRRLAVLGAVDVFALIWLACSVTGYRRHLERFLIRARK